MAEWDDHDYEQSAQHYKRKTRGKELAQKWLAGKGDRQTSAEMDEAQWKAFLESEEGKFVKDTVTREGYGDKGSRKYWELNYADGFGDRVKTPERTSLSRGENESFNDWVFRIHNKEGEIGLDPETFAEGIRSKDIDQIKKDPQLVHYFTDIARGQFNAGNRTPVYGNEDSPRSVTGWKLTKGRPAWQSAKDYNSKILDDPNADPVKKLAYLARRVTGDATKETMNPERHAKIYGTYQSTPAPAPAAAARPSIRRYGGGGIENMSAQERLDHENMRNLTARTIDSRREPQYFNPFAGMNQASDPFTAAGVQGSPQNMALRQMMNQGVQPIGPQRPIRRQLHKDHRW